MKSHLIAALLFGLLIASAFVAIGDQPTENRTTADGTHFVFGRLTDTAIAVSEPSHSKTCAPRPVLRYLLQLGGAGGQHHASRRERALMQAGPLEDIALGSADAPTTIVQYTSMTCNHSAEFQGMVFPELKEKHIDTGRVRLILREFPLNGLDIAAAMLVRCAGPDRYYQMLDNVLKAQETWATTLPGVDGKEELVRIVKEAGFSQGASDKCLADTELFNKIVEARQRAHDKFGVDSVPAIFVNGKRVTGERQFEDLEAALAGSETAATTD